MPGPARKKHNKPVQTLTEAQFKALSRADDYRRDKKYKDHENYKNIIVMWALPIVMLIAVVAYCIIQFVFLHNWEQFSSYAIAAVSSTATFVMGKSTSKDKK